MLRSFFNFPAGPCGIPYDFSIHMPQFSSHSFKRGGGGSFVLEGVINRGKLILKHGREIAIISLMEVFAWKILFIYFCFIYLKLYLNTLTPST